MDTSIWVALITGTLGVIGGIVAGQYSAKSDRKSAEHLMIDQLQEELEDYRAETNRRLANLERQAAGYRAFIGVQRDHMAGHGIPLPPWPDDLPR